MIPSVSLALFAGYSWNCKTPSSLRLRAQQTIFEVCLSPGCVADGADTALLTMQALATDDVVVEKGGCVSLCGSGPVVVCGNKKNRKMSSISKFVELLFENTPLSEDQQAVVTGLGLMEQAKQLMKDEKWNEAIDCFEKSAQVSLSTADEAANEDNFQALAWISRAKQDQATCQLEIGDPDGAAASLQMACDLSNGQAQYECYELLLDVLEKSLNDRTMELQTLQRFFKLDVPPKISSMQQNKRRTLGFRLQKLEREQSA